MTSVLEKDPLGFTFSIILLTLGFIIAGVTVSLSGADVVGISEVPPDEDITFSWWITEGPKFYPTMYFFAAIALMLFFFRVLMKP